MSWVEVSTAEEWDRRARAGGHDHVVADTGSPASHLRRLEAVLRLPIAAGDHVEDLGCGTGTLSDLLPDGVTYEGLDWSAEMVRAAGERRPGREFRVGTVDDLAPADWVVASGPFNYSQGWRREQTRDAIRRMWQRSRRGIAVTVLRVESPGRLAYSPVEMVEWLSDCDWSQLELDRSYLPNDMCVRAWRTS